VNPLISIQAVIMTMPDIAAFGGAHETSAPNIPEICRGCCNQDLVAGQIDLCFDTPALLPLVRPGSIKVYAVTSDTRMALAPEIPPFAEMGLPTLSLPVWLGLFAPKDTRTDIIAKLNAATVEALADPQSRLSDLGVQVFPRTRQTPEGLRTRQKADIEKWWPIIRNWGSRRNEVAGTIPRRRLRAADDWRRSNGRRDNKCLIVGSFA
jgi:tripartite-type tricarboxylate transporter receptor subunit TctC